MSNALIGPESGVGINSDQAAAFNEVMFLLEQASKLEIGTLERVDAGSQITLGQDSVTIHVANSGSAETLMHIYPDLFDQNVIKLLGFIIG